jgi:lysozyme family protein
MADFNTAAKIVLGNEGGYDTDKTDIGNYLTRADFVAKRNFVGTNYGVSAPILQAWRKRPITAADMRALTRAEALQIYKAGYWNVIMGDQIKNQSIADTLFDSAINHGTDGTVYLVQRVLKKYVPMLLVDGAFGVATLQALNNNIGQQLFNDIQAARIATYKEIHGTPAHEASWLGRLKKFAFSLSAPAGISAGFFLLVWHCI